MASLQTKQRKSGRNGANDEMCPASKRSSGRKDLWECDGSAFQNQSTGYDHSRRTPLLRERRNMAKTASKRDKAKAHKKDYDEKDFKQFRNKLAPFWTMEKPTCGVRFSRETDNNKKKMDIEASNLFLSFQRKLPIKASKSNQKRSGNKTVNHQKDSRGAHGDKTKQCKRTMEDVIRNRASQQGFTGKSGKEIEKQPRSAA
eukprot:gene12867-14192_t